MRIFTFLFILFNFVVRAETVHIQQLNEDFKVDELKKISGNKTNVKTLKEINSSSNDQQLPPSEEITKTLLIAGLNDEVKSLDVLAQDQLYLRASNFKIEKLQELYPSSNPDNLKKLIELINKRDKK
jgi:uncharacterized lipoprotein YehR (DUF1307 family)